MKKASASQQKALTKGGSEYTENRLKHSDPNYQSPVFPDPPLPYNGKDFYEKCLKQVKTIADEFGLYTVERTAGDLVQKGLRWKIIQVQSHNPSEHKDAEPIAMLFYKQPVSPALVDISVDSLISQIEHNYVQSHNPAA